MASQPSDGIEEIVLRPVRRTDLPIFYRDQLDPRGTAMAGFSPRRREAFDAHWARILADRSVVARTVVAGGAVAGYVVCFEQGGERLVGYWMGRRHWGRGIATRALGLLLALIAERPLAARVARHNAASIRVLEKCGFERLAAGTAAAAPPGPDDGELVFRLS